MISKMNEALTALVARFDREDGQALAEYGLLLALIAVVCIAALTALGLAISGTLAASPALSKTALEVLAARSGLRCGPFPSLRGEQRSSIG